jgi:hypothetical protein
MKDSADRPLLTDIRKELGALTGELRAMAAARWELARLELETDWTSIKRLAIVWLLAAVMGLTALPLILVGWAEMLDGYGHLARADWIRIFAGLLMLFAFSSGYFAWRCFRRRFVGLQETLEELREDIAWLKEKGGGE